MTEDRGSTVVEHVRLRRPTAAVALVAVKEIRTTVGVSTPRGLATD